MKKIFVLTLLLSMLLALGFISVNSKEAAAAGLSGEVTLWSMWTEVEPQARVIKEAIAGFEAANPGVKVKVQWCGRDIRHIVKPALDAGEGIDIVEQDPEWLTQNLGIDYFLKLDDYYAKTYTTTDGKAFKDTLIPALVTVLSGYTDGQGLYYVPNQPWVVAIFYSKNLFQKAGIDRVPQTWEEFLSVCEKLKASGVAPLTVDDAYMELLMGQYLGLLKGQKWVSQLMQDRTGQMWKDPAVLQFAKAYEELYKKGYISARAASNKYPAGQMELALENAAMYLNGSWLPNEVAGTTGPDYKWGAMAFPNLPNATEENTVMMFGSQSYAINRNSKNPDAAFELLTYIVNKEAQGKFSEVALSMPATLDTKWPEILADVKPIFETAIDCFGWGCGIWDGGDLSSIAIAEFTRLIGGEVTAEEFVANMAAAARTN